MSDTIPEAREVLSLDDVSINIGTITTEIFPQSDNNVLVQTALPTIIANGSRIRIQRYSSIYASKVIDKCVIFAAFNNCFICSLGFIYSFFAIFYIMLYFRVILTFSCIQKKDSYHKKVDIFLVITSYLTKTTWVGMKILNSKADTIFIILGSLTFFHDLEMLCFMNESLISNS